MIKKLIEIEGMHCEHCKKKVEDTLYSIPEVEEATVNLDKKNAKITLNEEVDDILIANLINNAGHYKVKNVTEIAE
ncbi:heavy-metal-associated domain-containing protein [Leptotrichia sp. oral taxon 218]|uniref:heavy-metal-associated domain-containing protein n=1 Tax=Leptotrichia sp. oral taxon 218 TaxID=712361 RepID=UPI001B8B2AF1|nr:heavy metal-associated domain-containing protein [Leptotrichia sp. oral taxon 218]QUB95137.1 heavy-metal-associated domain-containing protein [Leptotrichia sp. oral taxon 218]